MRLRFLPLFGLAWLSLAPLASATAKLDGTRVVGRWVFLFGEQRRVFQFNADHSYSGSYPVSGKPFAGTWRMLDRSRFVLVRSGKPGTWGAVAFGPRNHAELQADGYGMPGHRSDPSALVSPAAALE